MGNPSAFHKEANGVNGKYAIEKAFKNNETNLHLRLSV